jgi:hypothetical protein
MMVIGKQLDVKETAAGSTGGCFRKKFRIL